MKTLLCALLVLGLSAFLPKAKAEVLTTEPSAKSAANLFPPALLYNGEPLDPLCFASQMNMDQAPQTINLSPEACRHDNLVDPKYFSQGPYDRAVHFDYKNTEAGMGRPFLMVQYAGPALKDVNGDIAHPALEEKIPVIIRTSGGGTGQFSTLYKMQRVDEHTLIITDTLAAGDRCNSDITEAFLDADGDLNYAVNLTPYTMVVLGGDENRPFLESVRPYDDLDDCAACCYGKAHYNEDELGYVTLNDDLRGLTSNKDESVSLVEQTKQMCFDELIALQFQAGQTRFSPGEWETFIGEVEHTCLGRLEGEE